LELSGIRTVDISSDGSTVAYGAAGDNTKGQYAGVLFVSRYDKSSKTWKQLGEPIYGKGPHEEVGTSNGVSLSADGNVVSFYVGRKGWVRVYEYTSNRWAQVGVDIDDPKWNSEERVFLGKPKLSADGKTLLIGGDRVNRWTGMARVYTRESDNTWKQLGQELTGENDRDQFGSKVAMSSDGRTIAVSAYVTSGYGYVKVYSLDAKGKKWQQVGKTMQGTATSKQLKSRFGADVRMSSDGTTVAVSTPYYDDSVDNRGMVQVFELKGDEWQQVGPDIKGFGKNDYSGGSLGISGDKHIVAVIGSNLDWSGRVTLYKKEADDWSQVTTHTGGNGDRFGWKGVAVSNDGIVVAGGGHGARNGYLKVFDACEH